MLIKLLHFFWTKNYSIIIIRKMCSIHCTAPKKPTILDVLLPNPTALR